MSEAQNTMKTSMNYPFDRGYWTKSITKYKQKILECEQNHLAAVKYQATDQYNLQHSTTNHTNVISCILNHCNMQMSSTTTKQ